MAKTSILNPAPAHTKKEKRKKTVPLKSNNGAGLEPYSGEWGEEQARFLLRRTTFGPSQSMYEQISALSLSQTLDLLLADNPLPDPPVKHYPDSGTGNSVADPYVSFEETWVNAPAVPESDVVPDQDDVQAILRYRAESMAGWSFLQLHSGEVSIREKMVLFWHNHFVVAGFDLGHRAYVYSNLLRSQALGNFRQLTKDITIDTGMLLYLNGNENINSAPNENYARELLELFTVGKGELAGPGDYTTFTEEDVSEMSKVLTGWRVLPFQLGNTLEPFYHAAEHTPGSKQLSHRFNNAVIEEAGEDEYKNLIDVIFEQDECSRFICRKLYRWFVQYEITEDVEENVIEPMAQIMRDNDYNVKPALRALLESECFYSQAACMIKNPADFLLSITQGLDLPNPNFGTTINYGYANILFLLSLEQGMGLFNHPDVAGWKAYYQEPQFYRIWINNVTLPKRNEYTLALINGGVINTLDGNIELDDPLLPVLPTVLSLPNSLDPNELIYSLAARIFPYQISEEQKDYLKEILIPGLPDFEWTVEYGEFLSNPGDELLLQSIDSKLRALLSAMVQMPEFQLM